MHIILETHKHAPELNQATYFKKGRILGTRPAPGIFSIKDFRKAHHKRPEPGRMFKIEYTNSDIPSLNRVYQGYSTYKGCRVMLNHLKKKHNLSGGKLKTSIKVISV